VYNEKQDFYECIRTSTVPPYDVLVTNPPYSADHMQRLLAFCVTTSKPWFLLVPNYVYTKDYYAPALAPSSSSNSNSKSASGRLSMPFYVTPAGRRYLYSTPKGRRQEKSGKYTSPFPTFWYCQIYRSVTWYGGHGVGGSGA
jgi:hypothetical protein